MVKYLFYLFFTFLFTSSSFALDLDKFNKIIDETAWTLGEHCSATLVNKEKKQFLTAYHCVNSYIKIEKLKNTEGGKVREVEYTVYLPIELTQTVENKNSTVSKKLIAYVKKYNKEHDLALVQLADDTVYFNLEATVANKDYVYRRGDVAWAVSNPFIMMPATLTKGILSHVRRVLTKDKQTYIQYDGGGAPGSSGSGLFNDSGELIGVLSKGVTFMGVPITNFMFYIPLEDIHNLINE